jgi:DNA polymerase V
MELPTRASQLYRRGDRRKVALPLYTCPVSAGFPSPAEDYIEGKLDLNQYLIKNPVATFFVRVTGDSMVGAGIHSGDLLIVDRSLEPRDGRVVIAVVDGELLVKRIRIKRGRISLVAENPSYPPLILEEQSFEVWGVVTNVIHPL